MEKNKKIKRSILGAVLGISLLGMGVANIATLGEEAQETEIVSSKINTTDADLSYYIRNITDARVMSFDDEMVKIHVSQAGGGTPYYPTIDNITTLKVKEEDADGNISRKDFKFLGLDNLIYIDSMTYGLKGLEAGSTYELENALYRDNAHFHYRTFEGVPTWTKPATGDIEDGSFSLSPTTNADVVGSGYLKLSFKWDEGIIPPSEAISIVSNSFKIETNIGAFSTADGNLIASTDGTEYYFEVPEGEDITVTGVSYEKPEGYNYETSTVIMEEEPVNIALSLTSEIEKTSSINKESFLFDEDATEYNNVRLTFEVIGNEEGSWNEEFLTNKSNWTIISNGVEVPESNFNVVIDDNQGYIDITAESGTIQDITSISWNEGSGEQSINFESGTLSASTSIAGGIVEDSVREDEIANTYDEASISFERTEGMSKLDAESIDESIKVSTDRGIYSEANGNLDSDVYNGEAHLETDKDGREINLKSISYTNNAGEFNKITFDTMDPFVISSRDAGHSNKSDFIFVDSTAENELFLHYDWEFQSSSLEKEVIEESLIITDYSSNTYSLSEGNLLFDEENQTIVLEGLTEDTKYSIQEINYWNNADDEITLSFEKDELMDETAKNLGSYEENFGVGEVDMNDGIENIDRTDLINISDKLHTKSIETLQETIHVTKIKKDGFEIEFNFFEDIDEFNLSLYTNERKLEHYETSLVKMDDGKGTYKVEVSGLETEKVMTINSLNINGEEIVLNESIKVAPKSHPDITIPKAKPTNFNSGISLFGKLILILSGLILVLLIVELFLYKSHKNKMLKTEMNKITDGELIPGMTNLFTRENVIMNLKNMGVEFDENAPTPQLQSLLLRCIESQKEKKSFTKKIADEIHHIEEVVVETVDHIIHPSKEVE